jgi:hypothetical protein
MIGEWRILQTDELYNFYSSSSIAGMGESRKVSRVALMMMMCK